MFEKTQTYKKWQKKFNWGSFTVEASFDTGEMILKTNMCLEIKFKKITIMEDDKKQFNLLYSILIKINNNLMKISFTK